MHEVGIMRDWRIEPMRISKMRQTSLVQITVVLITVLLMSRSHSIGLVSIAR